MFGFIKKRPDGYYPSGTVAKWTGKNELTITLGEHLREGDTITCHLSFGCGVEVNPMPNEVEIDATINQ